MQHQKTSKQNIHCGSFSKHGEITAGVMYYRMEYIQMVGCVTFCDDEKAFDHSTGIRKAAAEFSAIHRNFL
jgi:hypothetical protein